MENQESEALSNFRKSRDATITLNAGYVKKMYEVIKAASKVCDSKLFDLGDNIFELSESLDLLDIYTEAIKGDSDGKS